MFDHILVPIDGSPLSALALPVAAELARCHHGTLTVLYVVPPLPVIYGESAYTFDDPENSARAKAEGHRLLEDARRSLGSPNIRLLCVEDGDPRTAQAIADVAEQQHCSLVVMGTHGRTGLDHFFLGSVAEGVMRRVGVPVLLVRAPKAAAPRAARTDDTHQAFTPQVGA